MFSSLVSHIILPSLSGEHADAAVAPSKPSLVLLQGAKPEKHTVHTVTLSAHFPRLKATERERAAQPRSVWTGFCAKLNCFVQTCPTAGGMRKKHLLYPGSIL